MLLDGAPVVGPCEVLGGVTASTGPDWALLMAALPPVRTSSCRHAVVLAAHLDEDVCAAGGLIARLAQRAVPIDVLAVTDGDGAGRPGPGSARRGPTARRQAGRARAYGRLGARQARFGALALLGGEVDDQRTDVVAALSEIVGFSAEPAGVWVLAPWRGERHPDHVAVGEAAALVCRAYRARLVEYCVGAWTERRPDDPVWEAARVGALEPTLRARKRYAVGATRPLRPGDDVGAHEVFFVTGHGPRYRPSATGSPVAVLSR